MLRAGLLIQNTRHLCCNTRHLLQNKCLLIRQLKPKNYSHTGNILVPRWERISPSVGIINDKGPGVRRQI